jgi:tetratricopeptide (TPR) repeat protein
LAFGLAVGGLALYNRGHQAPPVGPATENPDPAERPAPARLRLPAPRLSARSPQTEPEADVRSTNLLARWIKGEEMPKLTPEQIESYLAANRSSAETLLAAFQASGDKRWLHEAKEKYPNDPSVAFMALARSDTPDDRRQWLDTLKRVAPDNALADYLSANDYLKAGHADEAVRELAAANAKPKLSDYWVERVQNVEEAYRSAGYSQAEAKAVALSSLQLPQLAQFKQLAQSVMDLAASYRQAGDEASAQAALQTGLNLGQRLNTGQSTAIQDLVGMAVERLALSAMDPASPYGTGGQTVKHRIDDLSQQRKAIKALNQTTEGLLPNLSEQDLVTYFDRLKVFGESPTLQWLVAKYAKQ